METHATRFSQAASRTVLRRTVLRCATVIGTLALVAGVSACTPRTEAGVAPSAGTSAAPSAVTQFAIVTPENESDHGWNQQGIRAAQAVAAELGIKLSDNSNAGYDNTETVLTKAAEQGNDLVIAHASGFNAIGARVGKAAGVPTLVVDYDQNEPGTVGTIITEAQEGAYLAGVAAAASTTSNVVGIVASAEELNWFLMAGGFAQGVHSVDPSIRVLMAYIGPAEFGDSVGGKNVANQVIAAGADVIFGMGDGATVGYLQAVETAATPVRYIATIGDVSELTTNSDTVLASVLWDFTGAYRDAIADIAAGTFGTHSYTLTVANGGQSLVAENLSPEARAAVATATQALSSGSVSITKATSKDQVQRLVDAQ